MTCKCPQCTDSPAPTYTDGFKLECLKRHRKRYQEKAREVMMMPKESRLKFYQEYEAQRGKEDLGLFIEEVNRQWAARSDYCA